MPVIDLDLEPEDVELLRRWINADEEVGFVVVDSAGPRLEEVATSLPAGDHFLFHRSFAAIPAPKPTAADETAAGNDLYAGAPRAANPGP